MVQVNPTKKYKKEVDRLWDSLMVFVFVEGEALFCMVSSFPFVSLQQNPRQTSVMMISTESAFIQENYLEKTAVATVSLTNQPFNPLKTQPAHSLPPLKKKGYELFPKFRTCFEVGVDLLAWLPLRNGSENVVTSLTP